MDLRLEGRTAVVCASTGGLGRGIAEALAAEGANVVVSGRRAEVAQEIAAGMPSAVGVGVDLTVDGGPQALHEAAVAAFGQVDVLVLNGPGPPPGTAADLQTQDIDGAVASLLYPQHRLVSLALPGMRERGWGRILAVGSTGVDAPIPNLVLSNLGRAALAAYLKTLAGEVAADGVTVNLLLPGRIETDRVVRLDTAEAERTSVPLEEVRRRSAATIPAGRYGTAAEFGAAAAFLCSGPASFVTGTSLRCDGGMVGVL